VAHNLAVVEYISDRVAVMYVGKIVELGQTEEIFANPKHPYTEALLSAVPTISEESAKKQRIILEGDVADSMNVPDGCPFHPRCKYAEDICRSEPPPLLNVAADGAAPHFAMCHFAESLSLEGVTITPVAGMPVT
jgi:peptide/nickel transport system ATP-binding protein